MGERYTILETLGSGGFGSVYKAHDAMLHRDVAIKRLDKSSGKDELREQLLSEARVLATMQHANIVSIYDISSKADCDEIVMELLQGVSLDKLVTRHLLQPSDFRNVAGQILRALTSAHAVGVLHCDLKPENIMLCLAEDHYEAKVYDFGMSPPPGEEGSSKKLLGSIYVMAPELFSGVQPSPQSDLYALGCVLYFLLVGEYPFLGDSSVQIMASHITGNYIPLTEYRSDLSPSLCGWLDSLLDKDPLERINCCKTALLELGNIQLAENEVELTLSTTLKLEGQNSRLIRNISLDSLAVGELAMSSNNSTAFLSNSFSHSSPVAEKPALPNSGASKVKLAIDKGDQQLLPENAEWYFTIGDKVKGPVTLEQLIKLCNAEKVTNSTLVWHSLLGDWVAAESCSETKSAFQEKQQKMDEETARQNVAIVEAEIEEKDVELVAKKEELAWLGPEMWLVFAAMLATIISCVIYPEIRHYIISLYLFVVLAVGMSAARIYQMRQGAKWYSAIPVIGDLYHAITRPNTRNTLCSVMVIAGTAGMVIMGLGEAKAIENQHALGQVNSIEFSHSYLKNTQKPTPIDVIQEVVVVEELAEPEVVAAPIVEKTPVIEKPVAKEKPKVRQTPTHLRGLREFSGKAKTLKDL